MMVRGEPPGRRLQDGTKTTHGPIKLERHWGDSREVGLCALRWGMTVAPLETPDEGIHSLKQRLQG